LQKYRITVSNIWRTTITAAVLVFCSICALEVRYGILRVSSTSMASTISTDDYVVLNPMNRLLPAIWRRWFRVNRGQLVVCQIPRSSELAVKRVIAIGGDAFLIRAGTLYLNGRPVAEPYVRHRLDYYAPDDYYPLTVVPPGALFVLGDNRDSSQDSRHWGPVRVDAVKGSVSLILPHGRSRI
jgi:signal peptidase I